MRPKRASKRAVYSHYRDKENLFLSVVRETYEAMVTRIAEIVERTAWDRDLPAALTSCVSDVTRSIVRARALDAGRLLMAEAPHFLALIDLLHTGEIAAPLAQLTAAGRLPAPDPRPAAEHLSVLTVGHVGVRSLMGTVPLTEDETARLLSSGVQVFLRAYQTACLQPRRRRLSRM